jgi:hypothetical protein
MVRSVISGVGGWAVVGSSLPTNRRCSWVLIVILPAVVQSVASLLSSSSGPINGPDISASVLASPLHSSDQRHHQRHPGLERSDGNVTLPGESPVGLTEEPPQAM